MKPRNPTFTRSPWDLESKNMDDGLVFSKAVICSSREWDQVLQDQIIRSPDWLRCFLLTNLLSHSCRHIPGLCLRLGHQCYRCVKEIRGSQRQRLLVLQIPSFRPGRVPMELLKSHDHTTHGEDSMKLRYARGRHLAHPNKSGLNDGHERSTPASSSLAMTIMLRRETRGENDVHNSVQRSSLCRVRFLVELGQPCLVQVSDVVHVPHSHYWLVFLRCESTVSLFVLFIVRGSCKSDSTAPSVVILDIGSFQSLLT